MDFNRVLLLIDTLKFTANVCLSVEILLVFIINANPFPHKLPDRTIILSLNS